jgi:hypothetical protein
LQKLAGSEEILPIPGVSQDRNPTVSNEIKSSIGTSLSKVCAPFSVGVFGEFFSFRDLHRTSSFVCVSSNSIFSINTWQLTITPDCA